MVIIAMAEASCGFSFGLGYIIGIGIIASNAMAGGGCGCGFGLGYIIGIGIIASNAIAGAGCGFGYSIGIDWSYFHETHIVGHTRPLCMFTLLLFGMTVGRSGPYDGGRKAKP